MKVILLSVTRHNRAVKIPEKIISKIKYVSLLATMRPVESRIANSIEYRNSAKKPMQMNTPQDEKSI